MVFQQTILESQIEVQKQAFERVGAELYENVGQMLSVAQLTLCTLEESGLNDEQLASVQQISHIIRNSINDIRVLIRNLESYLVKDFDLSSNLRLELQRLRKLYQTTIELWVKGRPYSLGYEKEIVLFRNIQKILLEWQAIAPVTVVLDYQTPIFVMQLSVSTAAPIDRRIWQQIKQSVLTTTGQCKQKNTMSGSQITIEIVP